MSEKDKPKFEVIQGGGENSKSSPFFEREIKNNAAIYRQLAGPNASEMELADVKRRITVTRARIFEEILRQHGHDAAITLDLTPCPDKSYFLPDGRLKLAYYFNNRVHQVTKIEKTVTRGGTVYDYTSLKGGLRRLNTPPESSDEPPWNEGE